MIGRKMALHEMIISKQYSTQLNKWGVVVISEYLSS